MVVPTMAARLSVVSSRLFSFLPDKSSPTSGTLGILSFDAAKAMCRLISLYKSLEDDEVHYLHKEVIRSIGVSYLNSRDKAYLIRLAYAERLEALDAAANTVIILGRKCTDLGLNRFELVYRDLKLGLIDAGQLEFASRSTDRIVEKIEKLTSTTAKLYSSLETLAEMETSERKLLQWKGNDAAGAADDCVSPSKKQLSLQKANFDLFEDKIALQRKRVRRYKEASLWNQKIDKCVGLMARIVCIVFMRICFIFGSCMEGLSTSKNNVRHQKHDVSEVLSHIQAFPEMSCLEKGALINSGPIPKSIDNRSGLEEKFYSRRLKMNVFVHEDCPSIRQGVVRCMQMRNHPATVFHSAPLLTVGGSGLGLQYANIIMMADKFLNMPTSIGEDARSFMYEMLPSRLRMKVRAKLRRSGGDDEEGHHNKDHGMMTMVQAGGWRDTLDGIMEWLVPVARDTLRWQSERNLEKQRFVSKPTVLLIQTLHYSDLEKAEAAIVEVLVGLSCIFKYESKTSCFGGRKIN